MTKAWRWIRLLFRDLWLHFFAGVLCLVMRRHRDPVSIGEFRKPKGGYRLIPIYQCRKCFTIFFRDADVAKIGGRSA